jgi:hypothetical protein
MASWSATNMKQGILSNIWLVVIVYQQYYDKDELHICPIMIMSSLYKYAYMDRRLKTIIIWRSSTITANQMLLIIPCFMFVALQLIINDHY